MDDVEVESLKCLPSAVIFHDKNITSVSTHASGWPKAIIFFPRTVLK